MQAELLEALEEEHKQQENKKASKKKKKPVLRSSDKAESTDSSPTDSSCLTASSGSASLPACGKCAILQGPQKLGKKGKACSSCPDCKSATGQSAHQPHSSLSSKASSDDAPRGPSSPLSQAVCPSASLQRMSSSSGSSDHSAGSMSLHSSGSKSPVEPGTPSSFASQKTDDGWEVQQRSKRFAPSEKQGSEISGTVSQPRACRLVSTPHPALAAAWPVVPGSSPSAQKPLMRDVLVHHVHASPVNTEVLHLASGPVSFQPPPPPPPPRTRSAHSETVGTKVQRGFSSSVGNAWNVPSKTPTPSHASGPSHNAWASAVYQVRQLCCHPLNVLSDHSLSGVRSLARRNAHF